MDTNKQHPDEMDDIESALAEMNLDMDLDTDETDVDEDPNYLLGYKLGYDSGYIDGYEEGQLVLSLEKESSVYNTALDDIINHIDKFTFEQKDDVVLVLKLLRRI